MKEFAKHRILELAASVMLVFAGLWTFYSTMPVSFWFEYIRISAVLPVHEGEPIFFRSEIRGTREVTVSWVDVLHCRPVGDEQFRQIARFETRGRIAVQAPSAGPVWRYGVTEAKAGDVCFLRSSVTVHFPLRIDRSVSADSELFTVGPAPTNNQ